MGSSLSCQTAALQRYCRNAVTKGTDTHLEVTVRLEKGGRIVNRNGADTCILVGSANAYVKALYLKQVGAEAHTQVSRI